jgi:hypothetical protein
MYYCFLSKTCSNNSKLLHRNSVTALSAVPGPLWIPTGAHVTRGSTAHVIHREPPNYVIYVHDELCAEFSLISSYEAVLKSWGFDWSVAMVSGMRTVC